MVDKGGLCNYNSAVIVHYIAIPQFIHLFPGRWTYDRTETESMESVPKWEISEEVQSQGILSSGFPRNILMGPNCGQASGSDCRLETQPKKPLRHSLSLSFSGKRFQAYNI